MLTAALLNCRPSSVPRKVGPHRSGPIPTTAASSAAPPPRPAGATMPNPSVALCRANPITSRVARAISPRAALTPIARPSAEVVQPDTHRDQQCEPPRGVPSTAVASDFGGSHGARSWPQTWFPRAGARSDHCSYPARLQQSDREPARNSAPSPRTEGAQPTRPADRAQRGVDGLPGVERATSHAGRSVLRWRIALRNNRRPGADARTAQRQT